MLKLHFIVVGNKMPGWVDEACLTYLKHLREFAQVSLHALPHVKRNKSSNIEQDMHKEAELILDAVPNKALMIALDKDGKTFSSEELAFFFENIAAHESQWCFIIGGPDGIHPSLLQKCQYRWSLSKLTFPHTLARVIALEASYRALSISKNHPYHK